VIPAVEKAFEDIENLEEKSIVTSEDLQEMKKEIETNTASKKSFSELKGSVDLIEENLDRLTDSIKDLNERQLDGEKIENRLQLLEEKYSPA